MEKVFVVVDVGRDKKLNVPKKNKTLLLRCKQKCTGWSTTEASGGNRKIVWQHFEKRTAKATPSSTIYNQRRSYVYSWPGLSGFGKSSSRACTPTKTSEQALPVAEKNNTIGRAVTRVQVEHIIRRFKIFGFSLDVYRNRKRFCLRLISTGLLNQLRTGTPLIHGRSIKDDSPADRSLSWLDDYVQTQRLPFTSSGIEPVAIWFEKFVLLEFSQV